jgi:ketosteroid isomerase-like protein
VVAAVEPKPAPEKPAEKPAAAPANAEVLDLVNGWAKAWSAKNVDAYLAFYGKDFKTPGGESRADWEKARRQRISAPKSIAVTVESPKVSVADGKASVTFRQGYRSDVLKATSTTKTLVLAKADGRWHIQQERVGH